MIGFLVLLAIDVLLFVASALLMPKPKLTGVSPTFPNRPTSKQGVPIPVVWGTVLIPANVTDFSDVTATEEHEKVQTGVFSSHNVTVGYSYSAIMQCVLCHGPIDEFVDVVWQDILALNDTRPVTTQQNVAGKYSVVTTMEDYTNPSLPQTQIPEENGTEFTVFATELFGGYKHGGGASGFMRVFWGSQTQEPSDTLAQGSAVAPYPALRGIAHVVFGRKGPTTLEPFNFGEFGTIPALAFLVRKCPSNLGLSSLVTNIGGAANPAECAYEVLTNYPWGLQVPASEINVPSFAACAATLADEGFGIHLSLHSEESGDEVLTELMRYVDGQIQQNPITGLLEMSLNRADYDVSTLLSFDDSNCVSEITRPSWTSLVNQVKVIYTGKRGAKFAAVPTQPIDDIAAQREFGVVHSVTTQYLGVQDPILANKLAVRDLRRGATPLQRARVTTNRMAAGLKVGSPFKLTNEIAGVNGHVFRVVSINFGTRTDGKIKIDAVEDIFDLEQPYYDNPIDPPIAWLGVGPTGPVHVVATATSDETTGYLELTLTGGNGLVTSVQFREQSGTDDETAWHNNLTPDKFFTQVDLDEKHASLIEWQVLGHLKDGTIGPLANGKVDYGISTRPARPNVSYHIHTTGWADLIIDVDRDAAAVRYLVSYDHVPTFDEVLSQADFAVPVGERTVTIINAVYVDALNPVAYASAIALDASGNAGPVASITINALTALDFSLPVPIWGPIEVEGTVEDGELEGRMHIRVQFDFNTDQIVIYASEAVYDPDNPPPPPNIDENSRAHTITRQEGLIAGADDFKAEVDIATTPGYSRRFLGLSSGPTGLKGEPFVYFALCEDIGLGPGAPPGALTVIMTTVDGHARANLSFSVGDGSAETRVWRNGIILIRLAPGVNALLDDGLSPDLRYAYKIQHIKNGQTSAFSSGTGEIISTSPTLVAPVWEAGYPVGAGYRDAVLFPPSPGRCAIRCDNPDPLSGTDVFMSRTDDDTAFFDKVATIPMGGHAVTLRAEAMVGAGDPTNEFRWFYLVATRPSYTSSAPSEHRRAAFGNLEE